MQQNTFPALVAILAGLLILFSLYKVRTAQAAGDDATVKTWRTTTVVSVVVLALSLLWLFLR
jgi:hypothetical protein